MRFSSFTGPLGLLVGLASASPTPINPHFLTPLNEIEVRDPLEVARDKSIEKRISADFSLNHAWHNQVLFDGQWSDANDDGASAVSLSFVCRECWTKGDVTARLTTRDIIRPVVRLDLRGVEAYVDIDVDVSASAVYAINLFTSNSPVGIGFPGLSVGLVFYVDLVFSASAVLDMDGGFYVTLDEDASLEADIFKGDIRDSLFDGIATQSFPITVHTGSATFKAALRLRVQLGAETEIPFIGISLGGGAVVGVYANIVEFVAELEKTPTCPLETRQYFNLNVGAFARAGFNLDYTTIGVAPTVSTTLFDSPTFTQCWIDGKPAESDAPGFGRIQVMPSISDSPATDTAELPTPPHFDSVATTDGEPGSLVVASTLTTPEASSLDQQPRPTPPAFNGVGSPPSNFTITPVEPELITTTVYETTQYSITSCAANVINCPASLEKQIVVTKTIDAYTTVCPPGAVVTIPPHREVVSVEAAKAPVFHVITEVVHLHKLQKPIIHTFHPQEPEQPTKPMTDEGIVAKVASTGSAGSSVIAVPTPTAAHIVSVAPDVSDLPVAVQQLEGHPIHNTSVPHTSKPDDVSLPTALAPIPTAAASRYRSSEVLYMLAAVAAVVGLV